MKRYIIVILLISFIMTITGCNKQEKEDKDERARAVETINLKETEQPITLNYVGTTGAKEITNYSFKTGGRLERVFVEKGQKVKKGQVLARLDGNDSKYALMAAEAQMKSLEAQYEKALNGATQEELKKIEYGVKMAEDAYEFVNNQHLKMEELYKVGGISKQQLEQSELEKSLKASELNQVKETHRQITLGIRDEDKKALLFQIEQAKADYLNKLSLLEDVVLYANQEGRVIDIHFKENERIGPHMPLLSIKSEEQVIKIGVAQQDIRKITMGMEAEVSLDGEVFQGIISNISEMPDQNTRAYPIEISLKTQELPIGAIGEVSIEIGMERGLWIPMTSIFSSGEDYVYTIEEERAFKRIIELLDFYENKVLVEGVEEGEVLAIKGTKNLSDGHRVKLVK